MASQPERYQIDDRVRVGLTLAAVVVTVTLPPWWSYGIVAAVLAKNEVDPRIETALRHNRDALFLGGLVEIQNIVWVVGINERNSPVYHISILSESINPQDGFIQPKRYAGFAISGISMVQD